MPCPNSSDNLKFKASRDQFRAHYLDRRGRGKSEGKRQGNKVKPRAFLVGKNIYLRPITEKDISSDIYRDNIMTRELQHYTLSGRFPQSDWAIKEHWATVKQPQAVSFAICDFSTDAYVGNLALRFDWVARHAEFGRMIFREYQHNPSYSLEAMTLLMQYVFEDLKLRRLWGGGGNPSSVPSLLRLGFAYEGRMRKHSLLGGEWRDTFIMGLLAEEYFAIKQGEQPSRSQSHLYSQEILRKVIQIVAKAFNVNEDNLSEFSGPSDVEGWDSLGTMLLWSYLEEDLDLEISADDMVWITSIKDLSIMIEGKVNG
ncbi:MAG: GNAT family N-acetyltransferase [Desulfurivibrio sp.]|nr:GNAT family N-acetyltransferase [Desulfurivibrio sp.]